MIWPFPYDSPDSLGGQLQRGLGRGFLAALDAPRGEVHELLITCILGETRLDHQVDSRGWYYGELAWRTGMPIEALERHLLALGTDEQDDGWLTLDVLGHLTVRGDRLAVGVLRRYIDYGDRWEEALRELGRPGRPDNWEGLEEVAARRLNSCGDRGIGAFEDEPFATFARTVPEFVVAERQWDQDLHRSDVERPPEQSMSTGQLLQPPLTQIHQRAKVLAHRGTPNDYEVLALALEHEDAGVRALAARALAEQGSAEGYETAKKIILSVGGGRYSTPRAFARRALAAMPADMVLPLAREWRTSRRFVLRHASDQILKTHANEDDIPWIRRQLRRTWTPETEGGMLFAAELAGRLWHPSMLADVRRLYEGFVYSYGRMLLGKVLAEADPAFSTTLAIECLWDCEPEARRLGVLHADPGDTRVAQRLREIAEDPAEDEPVREAALALASNR